MGSAEAGDGVDEFDRTELLEDVFAGVVSPVVTESFERVAGAFVTVATLVAEYHHIFFLHVCYLVPCQMLPYHL